MQLKDYYTILELPPSASPDEIKKAYRRLAQVYHPDKNGEDMYALARFTEIKEAYETLTNPTRKAHYLQHRWYARSMGKPMAKAPVTPVTILQKALELDKYVRTLDVHRMDEEGLSHYMMELFSSETIKQLAAFNEPAIIRDIISSSLRTLHVISYPQALRVVDQLKKMSVKDPQTSAELDRFLKHKQSGYYWEKRRTGLVLAVVLLLCLLIFFLAKN